jgi:2-polyprenyl-3-methyl-5-hydroxy-6-metoxy-1,4-benzoquinol methylase
MTGERDVARDAVLRSVDEPRRVHVPTTIARPCPLCGATGGRETLRHDRWRLIECGGCGLAYMPEIPTGAAVETQFEWADSFKRERWERWMRNPLFRAATFAAILVRPPREYRAMRRIRRYLPPPVRMLDIGCGNGRLVATALAAKARRRLPTERILCGRLADFDLPAGSFDLITSVSYMEHEPDPAAIARRCAILLRPGGVCAHKTPNYASRLRGVLGAKWSGYRWPEHVQYFTPATILRLMQTAGFETIDVYTPAWGDNMWWFGKRID